MSINQRQFEQLKAMGINLWQSRIIADKKDSAENTINYLTQNTTTVAKLATLTIFTDILTCLNLSIGEVIAQNDHLDCGVFNWFFIDLESTTLVDNIQWHNNKLISPNIEQLSKSPALKRQLWQTITNNIL